MITVFLNFLNPCSLKSVKNFIENNRSVIILKLKLLSCRFFKTQKQSLWLGGAEVVTVSDLPGPVYPDLADPYHGDRPCCFSRDGRHVATGSEDGYLQVWDLTGAQV